MFMTFFFIFLYIFYQHTFPVYLHTFPVRFLNISYPTYPGKISLINSSSSLTTFFIFGRSTASSAMHFFLISFHREVLGTVST